MRYLDENFEVLAQPAVLSFDKREATETPFLRGDSFGDGSVDISDAVHILHFLFRSGAPPSCEKAADSNDDGRLGIDDPVGTLLHLFGGRLLPDPAGTCGVDPTTDDLTCRRVAFCQEI